MTALIQHALIGIGGFGRQHFRTLCDMERRVCLAAVCDPTLGRFPELSAELTGRGIRLYEDYCDMLERETDLTSVTIATPIPLHDRMARACLERGVFVYLEKPPVPTLGQLEELIRMDAKRRIAVAFQMVEADWSQQLKRWLADGRFGQLREIRVGVCWPRTSRYYNRAGWAGRMSVDGEPVFDGPATNALAHLIHNIMFFAGEGMDDFNCPLEVQGELYRARPIEGYDVACLRGRFASGCGFNAALTHASQNKFPFQIEVIGTTGWARVSEECEVLESSFGTMHCNMDTPTLVARGYAAFFDYVEGIRPRPSTLLADARGYSLATNAMLVSSGGIHSIERPWAECLESDDGDVYQVSGLDEAIAASLQSPLLFSEKGLPWAVKSRPVSTADVRNAGPLFQMAKKGSSKKREKCLTSQ
ncbi:MAG: Gfo/Idh/MocA family protein [Chthoniobacteraceae bacterium]